MTSFIQVKRDDNIKSFVNLSSIIRVYVRPDETVQIVTQEIDRVDNLNMHHDTGLSVEAFNQFCRKASTAVFF